MYIGYTLRSTTVQVQIAPVSPSYKYCLPIRYNYGVNNSMIQYYSRRGCDIEKHIERCKFKLDMIGHLYIYTYRYSRIGRNTKSNSSNSRTPSHSFRPSYDFQTMFISVFFPLFSLPLSLSYSISVLCSSAACYE